MTMAPRERDGAEEGGVDLWAMAAELERQFAGYKQRLSETRSSSSCHILDDDDAPEDVGANADHDDAVAPHVVVDGGGVSSGDDEDEAAEGDAGDHAGGRGVRGRMYEAYTRRRDERLRSVWRARMERKEAEVMALWARLDAVRAGGRAGGGGGPTTTAEEDGDDDGTPGEQEAEDEDGEKRRSSDVAAPVRVSGKKHPLTRRSFSSANLIKSSRPDVVFRRALSQEPPPPEPPAGADGGSSRKQGHRSRAVTGGAAPKRKALSGSKGLAKELGSLRHIGKKPPRGGMPRQCSSGVPEAAQLSNTCVATPVQISCSSEQAAASDRQDAREASPPGPFVGSGNGTGAENALAASPESDSGEVVDGAAPATEGGEAAEAKNAVINAERREGEEIAVQSPEIEAKLGNGEITSGSETEPSYVFIKKKDVEGGAMRFSDALGAESDAEPRLEGRNGTGDADQATTSADADTDAEIATTANAEEAPARESSDEMSSFSGTGRSGQDSAPNSAPSCSSRSQSIERLLEEDAALLRKKRQHQSDSGRRSVQAASTPPSTRGRGAASAARTTSPKGTAMGFKKMFLSFGKKNRGRDGATVIDCTSPGSVPASQADSGSARRRCRTADGPIRRRVVGSSSDAAASDDTEHGYVASPQACSLQSLVAASPAKSELSEMVPQEKSPKSHRSFFSFRSFNCGRG